LTFQESSSKRGGWEEVVVCVGQISVADNHISGQWLLAFIFENNAGRTFPVVRYLYVADGAVELEFDTQTLTYVDKRLDHLITLVKKVFCNGVH